MNPQPSGLGTPRISPKQRRKSNPTYPLACPIALALLASMISLWAQEQEKTQASQDGKPAGRPQALVADKSGRKMAAAERDDIVSALRQGGRVHTAGQGVLAQTGTANYAVVHVEFKDEQARRSFFFPGAIPFAQTERFADMFIASPAALDALDSTRNPNVRWMEEETEITVPPPPSIALSAPTRAIPEPIAQGGVTGYTGKNVIIAIIDSGVDFRNPDFILSGPLFPTSRLFYFWDTLHAWREGGPGSKPPLSFPNGAPVGTLYTRAQLTADLRASLLTRQIPATDENGHGTAAAGIAAGNGSSSRGAQPGVAADADIIGVSIGPNLEASFLLDAILKWLDGVARQVNKPLVVSCSFGGHGTGHDGTSITERHISSIFAPNAPGRAILFAAGNERLRRVHAKTSIGGRMAPGVLSWDAEKATQINLFFSMPNPELFIPSDLSIDALQVRALDPTRPGTDIWQQTKLEDISKLTFNPIAREWLTTIKINPGAGGITLSTASGAQIAADAYFVDPYAGQFRETFNLGYGPIPVAFHGEQVHAPATAENAIAVASYDWNDRFDGQSQKACGTFIQIGGLSCYSNPGFSRIIPPFSNPGYVKPDIAAPGQIYSAPYAHMPDGRGVNPENEKWTVDATGKLVLFAGTSAATPYAAGVVALMMQKKPTLTGGEIKRLLQQYATSDFRSLKTPNTWWGYGKLDLNAVQRILLNIR